MRRLLVGAALLGAALSTQAAETRVRLVSGRVLLATQVRQDGDHVVLYTAGGTVRVPRSQVASISDVASAERHGALNVLEGASDDPRPDDAPLDGPAGVSVEISSLQAIAHFPEVAADVRSGSLAAAEATARALTARAPGDPLPRIALGEVLLARNRHGEAVAQLEGAGTGLPEWLGRARNLALAQALWRLDRTSEAVQVLQRTPEDAGGTVAALRARLSGDLGVEDRPRFTSAHFSLLAPGGTPEPHARALLALLEEAHAAISAELGSGPTERIVVLLHPGTEFWESTGMGEAVGGLYDGKVRVPAGSIDPPSRRLLAVLKHEVAHAFVEALSGGRAPSDWHEGIAEHFEGSELSTRRAALQAHLERSPGAWPPPMTHATAHVRLEWFLERHGMSRVQQVLAALASQGTIERALQSVVGMTPDELDAEWARSLERRGR